jgi:hypothetical protein
MSRSDNDREPRPPLGPQVFVVEESRRPQVFDQVAPRVTATAQTGRIIPQPVAQAPAVVSERSRKNILTRLCWLGLAVGLIGWFGIDLYLWLVSAFDQSATVGAVASAASAVALLAAFVLVGREMRGYFAFKEVEAHQKLLGEAREGRPQSHSRGGHRSVSAADSAASLRRPANRLVVANRYGPARPPCGSGGSPREHTSVRHYSHQPDRRDGRDFLYCDKRAYGAGDRSLLRPSTDDIGNRSTAAPSGGRSRQAWSRGPRGCRALTAPRRCGARACGDRCRRISLCYPADGAPRPCHHGALPPGAVSTGRSTGHYVILDRQPVLAPRGCDFGSVTPDRAADKAHVPFG